MADDQLQAFLVSTFDYYAQRTTARLRGLSDREYFWEPVPDAWSLRQTASGWTTDWADPPPDPAPVTTIAWRLIHTIYCLQEHGLRPVAFERRPARWEPPSAMPRSAAQAIEALAGAIASWKRDLAGVEDRRLWESLGPGGGNYSTQPVLAFVEHIHDEFIHHSAEIALLRDLYRRLGAV